MDLSGRIVVVAGGAGALGQAIVQAIAARGAIPVILDRAEAAPPTAGRLYMVDATDTAAVADALAEIETDLGPIDALVNAIGRIDSAPLVNLIAPAGERTLPLPRFETTLNENLLPIFTVGAAVAERMLQGRRPGAIVNIGSVAARGNAGQSAYAAAKAAVHALTETWARELGRFGIRVVTVAPGFIETETMHRSTPGHIVARIVTETRLGRLGRPEEVAHAVVFALENDYLTATRIDVDGGLSP